MHSLNDSCCVAGKVKAQPAKLRNLTGPEHSLKQLELISKALKAISDGDLVDWMIHGSVLVLLIFLPPSLSPFVVCWPCR
jgi:hypothetical protein